MRRRRTVRGLIERLLACALGVFVLAADAHAAKTWQISMWTYRKGNDRQKSFTYAVDNAGSGDVLELQNDLTVTSDIEVDEDITVRSRSGKRYTITNKGRYYICNIHPGGRLVLENVIVDCANELRREDLFNLNEMEVKGSTTNIARMVMGEGSVIRNVYLSSLSGNENAAIHIKKGAVLRIGEGALIEKCNNESSPGKGGAICCDYGTVIMTGGTITGCKAKGAGGAIHTDGTRIDAVDVQGVSARGDIYISGGFITNNTCAAGFYGGAIYLGNSGPMLHITGSPVISNNFSGAGSDAVPDDVSTFQLSDIYANRMKLTGHSDLNPSGFTTNGVKFTGWVGVRYPLNKNDPQGFRFGGQWEYFNGTQEEPRQFFWNGDNSYRGRLEGNALIWSKHVTHELPLDGDKIAGLISGGEDSPLYIELNDDYEMLQTVYVPANYQIILDLQGHELKCDFHVENDSGQVVIRDSSLMKSGKVTGHRKSDSPTAFVLEGGSYHTYPPPEWVATNRVLIGNYCTNHPYMVASLAWETNETARLTDLTAVTLSAVDNEVRLVSSAEDIADITFSAGDWINLEHNNKLLKVQVFAVAAVSNSMDGAMREVGERVLLFDSDKGLDSSGFIGSGDTSIGDSLDMAFGREDSFSWNTDTRGLVKLIHVTLREQGENYVTNNEEFAYFKFPDAVFEALQRSTGSKCSIALSDEILRSVFGINRAERLSEAEVNRSLDELQRNGLMKWENIVTGTDDGQFLLSTAAAKDGGLDLSVELLDAGKIPVGGTGYSVMYDLRKSTGGGWARVGGVKTEPDFDIPLLDESGRSMEATGFYRVTTLVVPDADLSITNEIPSTNIVGVLEVSSELTNTLAAVPWVSLASDPSAIESVTVSNYLSTGHLENGDAVQVAQNGNIYRRWEWDKSAKYWSGAITVTGEGIFAPSDPGAHALARNDAVWVKRGKPSSKPFFLVGQYSSRSVALTIAGGSESSPACTLVSNPSIESVRVNSYPWNGRPVKGDLIRIPNEKAAPLLLTWNGSEWGRIVKVPGERYGVWKNDEQIAAGTGFWYMRCASAFEINLPLSKVPEE